jgi:hypothetical protein
VKKLLSAHLEHTLKDLRAQLADAPASRVDEPGELPAKRPAARGTLPTKANVRRR